jgi:hypothetical protein
MIALGMHDAGMLREGERLICRFGWRFEVDLPVMRRFQIMHARDSLGTSSLILRLK